MSIEGYEVGGELYRHDYDYLDNKPLEHGEGANSVVLPNSDGPNSSSGENNAVFGHDNDVSGNNDTVCGYNNIVTKSNSFVCGGDNNVGGNASIVGGSGNIVTQRQCIVEGQMNRLDSHTNLVFGNVNYTGGANANYGIVVGAPFGYSFKLTGAANATTYTYTDLSADFSTAIAGRKLLVYTTAVSPYPVSVVTAIDTANNTVTLDKTLSESEVTNITAYICSPNAMLHRRGAVFGQGNQTSGDDQLICGELNALDANAKFIVGNGGNSGASNAFVVRKNGDAIIGGSLTIGSTTITEAQLIALLAML